MTDNSDLTSVRQLRTYEPDDLSVARTRLRVQHAVETGTVERRPGAARRWLPVAASAAAAAAVVVASVVLLTPGHQGATQHTTDPGAQGGATATAPAAPTVAFANVDMTRTPVPIRDDQFLYQSCASGPDNVTQIWFNPRGMTVAGVSNNGVPDPSISDPPYSGTPSLSHPTPAYLKTLPADPAALLTLMWRDFDPTHTGRASKAFKQTAIFLQAVEPLLSPTVRAGFLAALQRLPGVTVDNHTDWSVPVNVAGNTQTYAPHSIRVIELVASSTDVTGVYVVTATGRVPGIFAGVVGGDRARDSGICTYAVVNAVGQTH